MCLMLYVAMSICTCVGLGEDSPRVCGWQDNVVCSRRAHEWRPVALTQSSWPRALQLFTRPHFYQEKGAALGAGAWIQ